jgi:hypothetical protein
MNYEMATKVAFESLRERCRRGAPVARERHPAHAEKFSDGQAASENSGAGAEAERAPNDLRISGRGMWIYSAAASKNGLRSLNGRVFATALGPLDYPRADYLSAQPEFRAE